MSDAIIVGLIAAIASIIAAILTARSTQTKVQDELHEQNAVQNVKIDHLAEEVRKHNDFAQRIPVIEEKIKVANNRISDLERRTQ